MAVPKKKTSHSRQGKRRSHWNLGNPTVSKCSNCGAACRSHRVCSKCGHYGNREIVVTD